MWELKAVPYYNYWRTMNDFVYLKKKKFFSRYLNFCVFGVSTKFKICDVMIDITAH